MPILPTSTPYQNIAPGQDGGGTIGGSTNFDPGFSSAINKNPLSLVLQNGFYGNGDGSDAVTQAQLAQIQKYDPNASISTSIGGDNNSQSYQINFDPSKLPSVVPGQKMNMQTLQNMVSLGPNQNGRTYAAEHLINPNGVNNTSPYGPVTSRFNIRQDKGNGFLSTLDKIVPYAVMSALGYGAGIAGTSLLGSAGLSGALGSTLGKAGGNFALQELASGGNAKFNPLQLVSSSLGAIPGVGSMINSSGLNQILPYLNAARNIYGATKGNYGSMANLARYGLNSFYGPGGH